MSDGLSLTYSSAQAEKGRDDYRYLIGLLMVIDAAMGLALLIWPATVSRLLMVGDPAATEWTRVAGLLVLIIVAFLWSGRHHPNRTKIINITGIVGRLVLGIALILIGGSLRWIGLFEIAAALLVARFYYRFFAVLVMSRP